MVSIEIVNDLHQVIRFADAMVFLGANNTQADMTGEQCAELISAILDRLVPITEQLERDIKAQH